MMLPAASFLLYLFFGVRGMRCYNEGVETKDTGKLIRGYQNLLVLPLLTFLLGAYFSVSLISYIRGGGDLLLTFVMGAVILIPTATGAWFTCKALKRIAMLKRKRTELP